MRTVPVVPNPDLDALSAELRRDGLLRCIQLGGLDEREVAELLGAHGDRIPATRASAVLRATEGNPLFVTELAEHGDASTLLQASMFNAAADGDLVALRGLSREALGLAEAIGQPAPVATAHLASRMSNWQVHAHLAGELDEAARLLRASAKRARWMFAAPHEARAPFDLCAVVARPDGPDGDEAQGLRERAERIAEPIGLVLGGLGARATC